MDPGEGVAAFFQKLEDAQEETSRERRMRANKKVTPEIFREMWDFHCRYSKSKSSNPVGALKRHGLSLWPPRL